MSIIVNKAAVRRALEAWFIAAREGKTLSATETAKLSSHDAAAASSDLFYDALCADEDVQQYVEPPLTLAAGQDIGEGEIVTILPDGKVMPVKPAETSGDDFFAG